MVFVTGATQEQDETYWGMNLDFLTIGYDASTGSVVWERRYDGPTSYYDDPRAIAVSPDGSSVYVAGLSDDIRGSTSHMASRVVAYSATTGDTLWIRRVARTYGTDALVVSPDGSRIFLVGETPRGGPDRGGIGSEFITVALDATTGTTTWLRRYDGTGEGPNEPSAIAVDPRGSTVFVTGMSWRAWTKHDYTTAVTDYATLAYRAATGHQLWVRRYHGPATRSGFDRAKAIAVDGTGSAIFVTGESAGRRTWDDITTLAYRTSDGSRLWTRRYNSPLNGRDAGRAVAISPDSSTVFVVGETHGPAQGSDALTIAYATRTGATRWIHRSDDPASVEGFVVSPDGSKLFVTGISAITSEQIDYLTIAYAASTGVGLWVSRYDGPAHDEDYAEALAVSPDGSKVFVTGSSSGSATQFDPDYLTVAYTT